MKFINLLYKKSAISLLLLIITITGLQAQIPTYLCELRNDNQIDAKTFEFDIYLLRTGATVFEYSSMQFGININSGARNGGTIAVSLVSGSSELNASQIPGPLKFSFDAGKNCIIMTGTPGPGSGSGTIISNTGFGTRVGTIRLVNTANFGSVTPDLTWSFLLANGYATKVNAYIPLSNDITVQASHTTSNLSNNILNAAPTVNPTATPGTVCAGGNVQLNAGASGGSGSYNYTWTSNPAGFNSSLANPTANPFVNTTYNVAVFDGVSTVNSQVSVNVNSLPATPTISASGPTTFCPGGSVTLTSSSGTTYLWSNGATTASINVTSAGSYSVRVTNSAGCQSLSSTATIVSLSAVPGTPTISASGPTTFCPGGSVTLTSSTGISYLWSNGATTPSINVSTAGSYTVQVTNAAGCQSASSSPTVVSVSTIPTAPTITASGSTSICSGSSVTLTSSPGSTYLWSTGAATQSINVSTAGSYTVQITNAAGCQSASSSPITVTVNALPATPTITASGPTTFCPGGSVTLTSSSGTTYLWSNGATTASINVTSAGSYSVRVTNSAGCQSASSTATVVSLSAVPGTPTISASGPTTFCPGGSVTLTSSTGISYLWSNGATTPSINVSTAGSYTVQVTNAAGCQSASSSPTVVSVSTIPTAPTITASGSTSICSGSSVTLTSSPGSTYLWSTGATTQSINVSTAGSYTVQITNAAGCQSASSSPITVTVNALPATPTITASGPTTFCPGGSVTLTSSSGTTYLWSNGATTASINVTTAGSYSVRVTNSAGCQSLSSTATIVSLSAVPGTPTISASGPTTFCQGGSVTLTSTSGSTYLWSNGATTPSINVTTSGSYSVQVTNPAGCQSASSLVTNVLVNAVPAAPTITASGSTSICSGSSVTLTSSPGSTYLWSTGAATQSINVSTAGSYTVQISNTAGCQSLPSAPVSVIVNLLPTIVVTTSPTCAADFQTYSLSVTVSGGTVTSTTGTVTNAGGNVWNITNVPISTGILIITVNNGICLNNVSVTAPNCACPVVNPPVSGGNKSYCAGSAIPAISATVSAGQTVDWYNVPSGGSPVLSNSLTYTPTAAGTYYAVARVILSGCISSTRTAVIVTMNPLPTPSLSSSDADNLFCIGTSVTFTAGGGTIYSFRIGSSPVQTGSSPTFTTTALTNGQVVDVIVINANGCSATSAGITSIVSAFPTPTLTSSDSDNRFCSGTSVTFTASGGTSFNFRVGGVSVQSGALATYTTTTLNNGETVDVIVTNAAGCSSPSSGITNIVNALPVILLTTPPSCSVDLATYSLVVTAITGTVTTTAGTATNTSGNIWSIAGVPSGTNITITVTNSNGCRNTLDVTAPGCACPVVPPPVSGGDKSYCAGGIVPTINATVQTGETVDWYNAASGGTLLRSASLTYTPTAAGTYYTAARNTTTNCVSTVRTAVIVVMNPLPVPVLTSSDADNIFCSGTSVTFTASGGVSYNFRVAGVSVQNGVTATYTTTTLRTGQVVDVIVTGANGCTATSAAITNSVNSTPTGNGGSGGNECDLDFIFKAVPSFGTGTWTLTSGPGTAVFTPNANAPNATVTVSAYGTYIFTWTEVSGTCSASSTVTVNFYKQPVAKPGTGGNNCGLEFYFSAILEDGIGTWSKVSGPGNVTFSPDPNTPNAAVTVTQFGTYTFRWTVVVNGVCSSSATVVVNFIQQTPANAGSGGTECDRDFILNASAPTGIGTWTKVSGPGNAVFSPDSNQRNATVTVDQFGTYRFAWTVVNVTCSSSDVVDVIFRDLPSLNAGPDMEMCKGNTIQLNAQGTGSFAWTPAELLNNPSIKNPIATPEVSTTFKVVLTDQYGCKNSDNVLVEVREKPVADAGPDQLLEYVFETTMDAQTVNAWETGLWSIISGGGEFGDKNSAKSSVTNISVGINEYAWTVSNMVCPASVDTVNVEVKDFLVPTLITPNMDGINDYFVLRGLETLGKTVLTVFDRRGAQVYKNSNYDNSWNGVDYNENPLIGDTYYYVIKAENGKSVSGYIVIRY